MGIFCLSRSNLLLTELSYRNICSAAVVLLFFQRHRPFLFWFLRVGTFTLLRLLPPCHIFVLINTAQQGKASVALCFPLTRPQRWSEDYICTNPGSLLLVRCRVIYPGNRRSRRRTVYVILSIQNLGEDDLIAWCRRPIWIYREISNMQCALELTDVVRMAHLQAHPFNLFLPCTLGTFHSLFLSYFDQV